MDNIFFFFFKNVKTPLSGGLTGDLQERGELDTRWQSGRRRGSGCLRLVGEMPRPPSLASEGPSCPILHVSPQGAISSGFEGNQKPLF